MACNLFPQYIAINPSKLLITNCPDHSVSSVTIKTYDIEFQVPFVERVYCDMQDQPLPWNIKQEIEGPKGQFIGHIVKTTQARVST